VKGHAKLCQKMVSFLVCHFVWGHFGLLIDVEPLNQSGRIFCGRFKKSDTLFLRLLFSFLLLSTLNCRKGETGVTLCKTSIPITITLGVDVLCTSTQSKGGSNFKAATQNACATLENSLIYFCLSYLLCLRSYSNTPQRPDLFIKCGSSKCESYIETEQHHHL